MKKSDKLLVAIYTIISIATSVLFIIDKEYSSLIGLVIVYILYLIYVRIDNKLEMPLYIHLFLVITLILHNTFGQAFYLYQSNDWFDKILHAIGAFSFSQLTFFIIYRKSKSCNNKLWIFLLSSTIGITLGVFFELGEFALDLITKSKHQHSLNDTNLDLLFNIFGSFISGILSIKKYYRI